MDISWFGQACFRIKGKATTLIIDPFDPEFTGLKFPKEMEAAIVLTTHGHRDHNFIHAVLGNPLVISGPGEYEKSGVSVTGVQAFHDNSQGAEKGVNTIYHILMDGINIVHLGDLGHLLGEDQIGLIDSTDILLLPVGNGGATIDAETAAKVVVQLEPKIVIPMHYKIEGLKFELSPVEPFLEDMGVQNIEPLPKFSVSRDKLPDETTVILLSKS